jgi:hypothetical protein
VALAVAIIATLVVVFWLVDTVVSLLPANGAKHEVFGLCVFASFAVIDWLLEHNARSVLGTIPDRFGRSRLEAEAEYYGGQALFTDLPVVVGMAVLLTVEQLLSSLPAFTQAFSNGFRTGGVAMHLAYSQFVFLVLTGQHKRRLRQVSLEERAARPSDSATRRRRARAKRKKEAKA